MEELSISDSEFHSPDVTSEVQEVCQKREMEINYGDL